MARPPIAILLPTLMVGDATGTDALQMRDALTAAGHAVHIFANESESGLGARPIDEAATFLRRHTGPVIYHQGTQWEHGLSLIAQLRGPLLIRDHNVTPPHFFRGVNESFVEATQAGLDARHALAARRDVACFLPCSEFSASELRALGVADERIAVLPPFHEVAAMEERAPDADALRRWSRDPADLLFVSRIAPNKGQRHLLRLSALHRELFGQPLRIRLVGRRNPKLELWERLLRREAARLGVLRSLDIVGDVTPGELKAAYLTSHIFCSASQHEGFCVPLVEAAWLGLPVVATRHAAVPETLGPVGLVFDEDESETDATVTMLHRLLTEPATRHRVARAQQQWMHARYNREVLAERFLEIVAPFSEQAAR